MPPALLPIRAVVLFSRYDLAKLERTPLVCAPIGCPTRYTVERLDWVTFENAPTHAASVSVICQSVYQFIFEPNLFGLNSKPASHREMVGQLTCMPYFVNTTTLTLHGGRVTSYDPFHEPAVLVTGPALQLPK